MLQHHWAGFKTYLEIDRKQAVSNTKRVKSAFNILTSYFDSNNLDFTRDNFNAFISYLLDKKYKPAYINTFIKFAKHLDRYLKTNELKDYTRFKEPEKLTECLTVDEITKLAHCKVKYHRLKEEKKLMMEALIFFLGCVGSRISETMALTKQDLMFEDEPMVYFRPEITKTGKGRFCVIPRWLYADLIKLPDGETLFNLDPSVVKLDLKNRASLCHISKNVYPHVFRHSSINNKLQAGMPLELVTAYHGHSSTVTTYKYYVHIQEKRMGETLFMYDPFFRHGLTAEMITAKIVDYANKMVDPSIVSLTVEKDGVGAILSLRRA